VASCVYSQAQLRAYAVRPGNQNWAFVALRQLYESPETADSGENFRSLCTLYDGLDALYELVAGVDVDACIAVSEAGAFFHGV
jgi:hypothetical protein